MIVIIQAKSFLVICFNIYLNIVSALHEIWLTNEHAICTTPLLQPCFNTDSYLLPLSELRACHSHTELAKIYWVKMKWYLICISGDIAKGSFTWKLAHRNLLLWFSQSRSIFNKLMHGPVHFFLNPSKWKRSQIKQVYQAGALVNSSFLDNVKYSHVKVVSRYTKIVVMLYNILL